MTSEQLDSQQPSDSADAGQTDAQMADKPVSDDQAADISSAAWSQNRRQGRAKRLAQIAGITHKYDIPRSMTPAKLRMALEELGPTFVKVGQILSMRSEILSEEYCNELAKLKSDADPMPFNLVKATVEHEYHCPIDKVFSFIDPQPLGSASLAQVHRATLITGEDVAIKVQRPGVKETMAQDIEIIRFVANAATKIASQNSQIIDFMGVVDELWETFQSETDFTVEAKNLQEFKAFANDYAYMDCPRPYMHLCTQHIVVMDYIDGIPISDFAALRKEGYDLEEIGTKLVDNYATQVLDRGFFHADPHSGNIIIRGGQIVLIDLGMVGRISSEMRSILRQMIFAVPRKDSVTLEEGLLRLADISSSGQQVDNAALLADIDLIISDFGTVDLNDLDIGKFIMSMMQLASRNKLKLPGSITTVARSLVTLEGLVNQLMPQANIIDIITSHVISSVKPADYVKQEAKKLGLESQTALYGALNAMTEAGTAARMLTRGQLKTNLELVGSEEPLRQLSFMVDRLTIALIVVGLYVGSSIVYFARIKPVVFGIPVIGFMGYIVAFVLSCWIVIDIMRKNRDLKRKGKTK